MPDSTANLAIRVRDLSKAYRVYSRPFDRLKEMFLRRQCHELVHALQPVSFDVRQGECVGVVGHNGAGKTTLLSLLTGTLAPTTGQIEVYGRVSSILGLGAGMIPTDTGRENVRHGLITRGIEPDRWEELEREIIAFSELAGAIDKPVQTYSSGMAMRLNFSIAHAVEPDILIVDEALAVGDAKFVFKCQKKMREFLDKGKTLFFVSHNVVAVRELCTTALLLHRGKLLNHGDVNEILDQYRQIYAGVTVKPVENSPAAPAAPSSSTPDRTYKSPDETSIELISVEAVGATESGSGLWRIGQGDTVELCFRLRSRIHVETPALGVVINSGYRNRLFGYSTTLFGEPISAIEPGEFKITFRAPMYVHAGQYVCEIGVYDIGGDEPKQLARWEEAAKLIVEWRRYSVNGIADVGSEIEYGGRIYSNEHEKARRQAEKGTANNVAASPRIA